MERDTGRPYWVSLNSYKSVNSSGARVSPLGRRKNSYQEYRLQNLNCSPPVAGWTGSIWPWRSGWAAVGIGRHAPYRDQFIPPDRGLPSIAAAPDPGQARARPTFGREVPDTDHSRHLDAARLADVARASHRCFRNQVLVAAT